MSGPRLTRLRWRLTAAYGVVSLIALAFVAAIAIAAARDRAHERLDHRVEATALAADGYAYPEGDPSRLVVDRQPDGYFGPERRPGSPVLVVGVDGAVLAGPQKLLDTAAARRAVEVARTQRELAVYGDAAGGRDVRVASSPVHGADRLLATIVALEPVAASDDEIRDATVKIAGGALLLWLLTVASGWLLAGRALRPAAAVAQREEAFLADAAHELRTPVAVIRARAEQALREVETAAAAGDGGSGSGDEAPAADALRAIERAAERASGTIADMLELARLDARRGRIEHEPLRLDLLLEQVAEEHREAAAAAGAELRLESDGETVVEGDDRLLARAVANLVENAIRYGAVGGEVALTLTREGETARVLVADRGPGVPPAQRDAVFDRFHRATATAGGSGLGLPIARLVAEAHGGTVALLPADDAAPGARFELRLPTR
ncbi:MAG TPA: HAMP domain-containing sensor histidine kinase [Conexibacter sp.]|nr:HAMP domain-containing sensor histidine kinase [Conexibacter sp.]